MPFQIISIATSKFRKLRVATVTEEILIRFASSLRNFTGESLQAWKWTLERNCIRQPKVTVSSSCGLEFSIMEAEGGQVATSSLGANFKRRTYLSSIVVIQTLTFTLSWAIWTLSRGGCVCTAFEATTLSLERLIVTLLTGETGLQSRGRIWTSFAISCWEIIKEKVMFSIDGD